MISSVELLQEFLFTFVTVAILFAIGRVGIISIDMVCGAFGIDEFTTKTLCYAFSVIVGLIYTIRSYQTAS